MLTWLCWGLGAGGWGLGVGRRGIALQVEFDDSGKVIGVTSEGGDGARRAKSMCQPLLPHGQGERGPCLHFPLSPWPSEREGQGAALL